MYNASNHPARRLRHGDRPTAPLSFEDPAVPLVFEDDPVRDQLARALQDAHRIIKTAIIEGQLRTDTDAQKQNSADARGLIGGMKRALLEAGVST